MHRTDDASNMCCKMALRILDVRRCGQSVSANPRYRALAILDDMTGSTLSSFLLRVSTASIALLATAPWGIAAERLRPTFESVVATPKEEIVMPLLSAVCGDGVRPVTREGQK